MKNSTVVGIELLEENIDPKDIPKDGIVSFKFIKYNEMDDETLQLLWEQSPDIVVKHRLDWVLKNHPNSIN